MQWLTIILWIFGGIFLMAATLAVIYVYGLDRTNGKLVSSGRVRRYLLHLPPDLEPGRKVPLILSLHGLMDWPARQAQMSGWNELADEHGFLVVYPAGLAFPKRWHGYGTPQEMDWPAEDLQFIKDLIDQLGREYPVDPQRIYVNGFSNGGGMSYLLACALSERIAAVGCVSGAYLHPLADCRPSRPVPMILFHGTADPVVPYYGGTRRPGRTFPSVPDWVAAWAGLNGCQPVPEKLPDQGSVSGIRYRNCSGKAEVAFYTIQGGGHSWPGGKTLPAWLVGPSPRAASATRLMWQFFNDHPLERG